MATKLVNNVKLGLFVLAGLLLLIFALYMIGRDSNLFGRNYELRARFDHVQGLTPGNNVRYAGIQVGTVRKVKILSDTLIEITMLIEEKMKPFIHKTDIVSISTDGLMGNKLINITPSRQNSPVAEDGDILVTKKIADTEEMLETLSKTNYNLALISEDIKQTVQRVNNSKALWAILDEPSLPGDIKKSLANIRNATGEADEMVKDMHAIITDVKAGKGSLGAVLTDTAIAYNLNEAIRAIRETGENTRQLADQLTTLTQSIQNDLDHGKGTANALLRDSALAIRLSNSLSNIEKGTSSFNQNMEALKHNFLLRGYFRKQEKQKKKQDASSITVSP
jgi:phospholipid/cholesterol/gamma-HCH transport system substrate-binding protein